MRRRSSFSWMLLYGSLLTAAGTALFATFIYTWQSGQNVYAFLLEKTVASVPVVLFVLGGSVLFGAVIGYLVMQQWKQRTTDVTALLLQIERGHFPAFASHTENDEFSEIARRILSLGDKLREQSAMFQRLADDRVLWSEEMRQEAVSQERHRLARDLHDSVSQQLFAMSMMMSAVNAANAGTAPVQKQLQMIETMIVTAQAEMRALLLHLRPVQLEGKKLAEGITELLTELSRKQHIEMKWLIDPVQLTKGVEDQLFRILQEALSNTLRHSRAKQMEVRLRHIESHVLLRVLDDGVGFDVEQRKAGAYGLQSIQERVQEIGGTWKIMSLPGKGTQLEVKVPLLEREEEVL